MPVDAAFFTHFDAVSKEIATLAHTDSALATVTSKLNASKDAERIAEDARVRNQREQARRRKKIERCESHWFYSSTALQPTLWCSGGVEGRIERQKMKLARDEELAPSLASKEADLEARVGKLQDEQAQLEGNLAYLRSIQSERDFMFETAIASAPTPQLNSLNQSAAQWNDALRDEHATVAQLQHSAQGCAQARQLYYQAMQALHAAGRTNESAQFNNMVDGSEMVEHMQQDERDHHMHRAQHLASQASQVLSMALSYVPPTATAAYPHLCSGLGHVIMPQLEQSGSGTAMLEAFGGDFGDALAGQNAANQINRNIQLLAQCERITAQQEGMVNALLQSARQAAANAGATLQQIKGSIAAEKQAIFNNLRSQHGTSEISTWTATAFEYVMGVNASEHLAAGTLQAAWHAKHASATAKPVENATMARAVPDQEKVPVAVATVISA